MKTDGSVFIMNVIIYTDGACSGNPGPGGWACVLIYGPHMQEYSGYDPLTTNNRMELTAAIRALRCLKRSCEVDLYSDSAYLVNAFQNGWLQNWLKNGWKTSAKKPVENRDLWEELIALSRIHRIQFFKVRGHADNRWNNRCDELAVSEIQKHKG